VNALAKKPAAPQPEQVPCGELGCDEVLEKRGMNKKNLEPQGSAKGSACSRNAGETTAIEGQPQRASH
jgi:hypothetical protein